MQPWKPSAATVRSRVGITGSDASPSSPGVRIDFRLARKTAHDLLTRLESMQQKAREPVRPLSDSTDLGSQRELAERLTLLSSTSQKMKWLLKQDHRATSETTIHRSGCGFPSTTCGAAAPSMQVLGYGRTSNVEPTPIDVRYSTSCFRKARQIANEITQAITE